MARAREEKAALETVPKAPTPQVPAKKLKASSPASSPTGAKGTSNAYEKRTTLPENAALREEIARLKVLTAAFNNKHCPHRHFLLPSHQCGPSTRTKDPICPMTYKFVPNKFMTFSKKPSPPRETYW